MQQLAQFYAVCARTLNRSSLMLYDVIYHNDVTSILTSYVFGKKYTFYWCINLKKFFSLTHRLAKLFERPSYHNYYYTVVHKKHATFIFLNSSVQHWPILIISGVQHQEETRRKWLFGHLTLILLRHYLVKSRLLSLLFASGVNVCCLHSLEDILSTCCNKEDVMWYMWLSEIQ